MPDWSRIHQERRFSPWSLPLAFLSLLYGIGIQFRLKAYEKGILKGKSLPGFVLSVGNITAGGTGKTPAVAMLAKWALSKGYCVAILSKGYGGRYKQEVLEVSDGHHVYADPQIAGDEPSLLARGVSGSPVIISKNRYRAGMYAHNKFGSNFFILDDGFQHLGLERNLNLVLIDASNPFGNFHLLPRGPLREPLSQLKRADALIITRFSRVESAEGRTKRGGSLEESSRTKANELSEQKTVAFLREKFPSKPLFCANHVPEKLVFPLSGEAYSPGFLSGKPVVSFAGIAYPEHFKETLIELGADVIQFKGFRDHHHFNGNEIRELIRLKEKIGASYLLTTEKDWMRIAPFASATAEPMYNDLAYLSVRFAFLPGQEGLFEIIRNGLTE